MKTLILVRHAESNCGHQSLSDFERRLNSRGKRDLQRMPLYLKELALPVDHIVSSPANRALSTAQCFAQCLAYSRQNIETDKRLYGASLKLFLQIVTEFDDAHSSVLLFAHNPTLTEAVNYLSDQSLNNLPTCGIALLQFRVDCWEYVIESQTQGVLSHYYYPDMAL